MIAKRVRTDMNRGAKVVANGFMQILGFDVDMGAFEFQTPEEIR